MTAKIQINFDCLNETLQIRRQEYNRANTELAVEIYEKSLNKRGIRKVMLWSKFTRKVIF